MKNRFNRLGSKEWLPFQKSWFRFSDDTRLYREHLRFFCKAEDDGSNCFYLGHDSDLLSQVAVQEKIPITFNEKENDITLQYAILDLRKTITDLDGYYKLKAEIIEKIVIITGLLEEKRFISIFVSNIHNGADYYPIAWDLAYSLSSILSLKDEKIACLESENRHNHDNVLSPEKSIFYCLNFRKEEQSFSHEKPHNKLFSKNQQSGFITKNGQALPAWFILKPQPRKKSEILHPAKYPEELVEMFINTFTVEGDCVLDPMSGTGSTQVAALRNRRNAYGTELSSFFYEIAKKRCSTLILESGLNLFETPITQEFKILNKDARLINSSDFPPIDYIITSPPYWDMLNMKGAENQAKRIEKGLQTNYSDNPDDLGNIEDYNAFLKNLGNIYFNLCDILKPGGVMTIVVKNIKKKGKNYPFAWDLADILAEKLILMPEVFWCQDDINLAPYGYGNTFVSNTFHQYCLNFQKAL